MDANRTTFIWSWYGHHGRLAYDGARWAGYYGASLSGSSQTLTRANCAQADSTLTVGIDVHQGDQMRVVDASGAIQPMGGGFDWGCSHSYYERLVYDSAAKKFVQICETDASNQLMFAPRAYTGATAIYAIDMQREIGNYSNIGNVVLGTQGGYWATVSKSRANAAGMADVHLLHFTTGAPDKDLIISNDAMLNNRSNHLAKYGNSRLLAAWENASAANDFTARTAGKKFYLQTHNAGTGEPEGGPLPIDINGNRYFEFRPAHCRGSIDTELASHTAPPTSATRPRAIASDPSSLGCQVARALEHERRPHLANNRRPSGKVLDTAPAAHRYRRDATTNGCGLVAAPELMTTADNGLSAWTPRPARRFLN